MAYYLYLSVAGEDKISLFTMDPASGRLRFRADAALGGAPGPLAVDPACTRLYAGIRSTRRIASFRIDRDTGGLSPLHEITLPSDPCYLSTDRTGRFLLSAYYGAGAVAVHPIGADGAAEAPPVAWRETRPHAHAIRTDGSNRFAFAPHVAASNVIYQFAFDARTGALTPNATPAVPQEPDTGPRHYVFHPEKEVVYVSNEQGSSVTAYRFDASAGTLEAFQTISTLPADFDGENTCAQIHITPSGRFLYVSNRGHESIACFAIDASTGGLSSLGQQPTEAVPRAFNIDPQGRFLFAAGQGSGNMASYRIDSRTGALAPLAVYPAGRTPSWVMILRLGGA